MAGMDNTQKIWFIQIGGNQEGPFSVIDLKRDPRVNPDTLVWRKGFNSWLPIRKVPELKNVFKDEPSPSQDEEEVEAGKAVRGKDALVIDRQKDPPPIFFFLLIILIVVLFMILKSKI